MNNLFNVFKVLLGLLTIATCVILLIALWSHVQFQFKINENQEILNRLTAQRLLEIECKKESITKMLEGKLKGESK